MKFTNSGEAYGALVTHCNGRGMNQTEMASKIGVTPQAITNILRRDSVKLDVLKDHAAALGFKVEVHIIKTKK